MGNNFGNEIDLGPFYEAKKLSIEGCWNSCGGSSCCKLARYTKNESSDENKAQVIHLYDFELDYLVKHNQLDPEFAKTLQKNEFIVNNWKITFYNISCGYGGLCPNHKFRPLSCFLYPYIPYFNADGTIVKMTNISLIDDILDDMKIEKPCTLYPKFSIAMYQDLVDKFLPFSKFYFYSNIYFRIKEMMNKSFNESNDENNIEDALEVYRAMFSLKSLISIEDIETIIKEENAKFKVFL